MVRWTELAVLAALAAGGCGEAPATQVMVVIDADDSIRPDIAAVRIEVLGGAGDVPSDPATEHPHVQRPVGPTGPWPITHAIAPLDDDASRRFRVDATALDASGEELVTVRAISGFVEGRTMALRLRFHGSCRGVLCDSPQTCGSEGSCVSAIDPPLEMWRGIDGGPPSRDGGTDAPVGDAGDTDGATPADGGPPDGGALDAGPPPMPTLGWSVAVTTTCATRSPIASGVSVDAAAVGAVARGCNITAVGGTSVSSSGAGGDELIFATSPAGTVSWAVGFDSLTPFFLEDIAVSADTVYVGGSWRYDEPDDYFRLPHAASTNAFAAHMSLATRGGRAADVTLEGVGASIAIVGPIVFLGGRDLSGAVVHTSRAGSPAVFGTGGSETRDLVPADTATAWAVGSVRTTGVVTAGDDDLYPQGVDGFVIEVEGTGSLARGMLIGGPGSDHAYAVATAPGRVYVGGVVEAGGVVGTTTAATRSAYVAALDAATLDVIDAVLFPVDASSVLSALAVRADDGAIFTGGYAGTGAWTIGGAEIPDWVLVRLDSSLDVVWQTSIPSASTVPPLAEMNLALLPDRSIVVAGAFEDDAVLQQVVEVP